MSRWQFWIDRGGTFTDVVARDPQGAYHTHKLLSEAPERYADAALQGIRDLMGIPAGAAIPAEQVLGVKMGTTVATNALLERKGERLVLLVTRGLADALRIGNQTRPRLFELDIELPELLYERVVEIGGRYRADGLELEPLDADGAREALARAHADGIRACAIAFMHGYRYHDHEAAVADIAREIGFTQISVSHRVSPLMKLVGRGDTTVVDAYLSPILRRYVDRVAHELDGARLMFMQSNGGLTDARLFQGKDSILSGPAGGVVGAVRTAARLGIDRIIGFDMGGTSTDVSQIRRRASQRTFGERGGRRPNPCAHDAQLHTVAAGGGSILPTSKGGAYRVVGPQSVGRGSGATRATGRGGPTDRDRLQRHARQARPDVSSCACWVAWRPTASRYNCNASACHQADSTRSRHGSSPPASDVTSVQPGARSQRGFSRIAVEYMAARDSRRSRSQRGHDVRTHYDGQLLRGSRRVNTPALVARHTGDSHARPGSSVCRRSVGVRHGRLPSFEWHPREPRTQGARCETVTSQASETWRRRVRGAGQERREKRCRQDARVTPSSLEPSPSRSGLRYRGYRDCPRRRLRRSR